MRTRRLLGGLALSVAAFFATGAGAQPAPASLTVAVESPFGIDPHFLFVGPNMAAARHIYDSVINRDSESRFVPGLVESWEAPDDTTWLLKLRQGVTFHDGSPFTAEDIAFSIARVRAVPNNPGPYTSNLRTIAAVEVVDPFTVRIRTDRPNPTLMGQLTNIFVVSHIAARGDGTPAGASTADFNNGKAAIGTGPFRLVQMRGSEGMSLERNSTYWGPAPAYGKVELRVIGNDAARLAALLSGDVDLIESMPPGDVARLEREPRVSVFRRNSDRIMYLIPHVGAERLAMLTDADGKPLDHNPLRDLRVRRALSMALDRTALATRALDGQAVPTGQMVPQQFGAYDPGLAVPAADPEGARRLLAEAGYPRGFGLTVACSNNRFVNDARVCQAVGQMFTRAGFQAKVETMPGTVFFPRTVEGKNEYPVILFGLSLSSSRDAAYILSTAVHTRNVREAYGQGNRGSFSEPEMDQAIQAAITRRGEGREEGLRQVMRTAIDRAPIIPMYNQVTLVAAKRGVVYEPRMDEQLLAQQARPAQ
ncbi:ABC transporter substrate-binding protein [Roseomonas sp. SSH11]|uniref:ABC transporter substrate-binding protein n=1 Tax=Pararoseomonas baculiformis TaxID=2820812 RepID=A0ABS4A8K9_9PROT|nr:ABC transporter substrate-binding protein [Pararoseomonas baculiformis]MBP0443330.1 ABC transporter substrate-binding protein [Pararoseomonas baculiformis]